jgi:hypothetical protein
MDIVGYVSGNFRILSSIHFTLYMAFEQSHSPLKVAEVRLGKDFKYDWDLVRFYSSCKGPSYE